MGWGYAAGIGAQLLGSVIQAETARQTNEENKRIAQDNRYFQETMSNSAFQRQMADMKKAGYNPMIATGSGATTPPGAGAQLSNPYGELTKGVSESVASALALKRLNADIEKIETSKDVDRASVHGIVKKAELDEANASSAKAYKNLVDTQTKFLQLDLPRKAIDSKMAPIDAVTDRVLKLSPFGTGKRQLELPQTQRRDGIYGPYGN